MTEVFSRRPLTGLLVAHLVARGLRTTLLTFAMIYLVATAAPLALPVMRRLNRAPRPEEARTVQV